MIHTIPNVKFITPSHRCYEYILDFVVALSSYGSFFKIYQNQLVTSFAPIQTSSGLEYPSVHLAGRIRNVSFIPHELFIDIVVNDTRNSKIAYVEEPYFKQIVGVSADGAQIIEGFANAMFIRYYEDNIHKIKALFGNEQDNWPEVLRFSRVVRNSMSHGGKIEIRNQKFRPVNYSGLTYSFADNGKRILHNTLTAADIFFLMLDMDLIF